MRFRRGKVYSSASASEVTGDVDPIDRARFGMKSAFAALVRGTSVSETRPHRAYGAMEENANSVVKKKSEWRVVSGEEVGWALPTGGRGRTRWAVPTLL